MLRLLIGAVTLAYPVRETRAQGIVLVKERGSASDAKASSIAYAAVERSEDVFRLRTPAGEVRAVAASRIVRDIEFSQVTCPGTVLTSEDLERLKSRIALLLDTIERWPESREFLQRYLDYNKGAQASFERGYVLNRGKWMTRSEYLESRDPKILAEEARQRAWAAAEQQRESEARARMREAAEREEQLHQEEAARQTAEAAARKAQQMRKRQAEAAAMAERSRREEAERQERERRTRAGWLLAAGSIAGSVFGAWSLHTSVRYGVQVVLRRRLLRKDADGGFAKTTPYTKSLAEANAAIAETQGHLKYNRATAGTQYCRSCGTTMPITFQSFEKPGPAYVITNGYGLGLIHQTSSSEYAWGCSRCGQRFYYTGHDAVKEYEAKLVQQKAVRAQILTDEATWKILKQWASRHPTAAEVARVILGLRTLRFRDQPIARKGRKKVRAGAKVRAVKSAR